MSYMSPYFSSLTSLSLFNYNNKYLINMKNMFECYYLRTNK